MVLSYNIYDMRENVTYLQYSVCTERVRSLYIEYAARELPNPRPPYIEYAASELPNPARLEGEVRYVQAQGQQMLLHIVPDSNWVFTHSLDAD